MAQTIHICTTSLEEPLQLKKERWLQLFLILKLQSCEARGAGAAVVLGNHLRCYHGARKSEGTWDGGSKGLDTSPCVINIPSPSSYLFWLLVPGIDLP